MRQSQTYLRKCLLLLHFWYPPNFLNPMAFLILTNFRSKLILLAFMTGQTMEHEATGRSNLVKFDKCYLCIIKDNTKVLRYLATNSCLLMLLTSILIYSNTTFVSNHSMNEVEWVTMKCEIKNLQGSFICIKNSLTAKKYRKKPLNDWIADKEYDSTDEEGINSCVKGMNEKCYN